MFSVSVVLHEKSIRDAFYALRISLADQVGVHILGSGNLGMSQSLGDANRVGSRVVADGCHSVMEFMGMDMGQIMVPLKSSEETAQSIRRHGQQKSLEKPSLLFQALLLDF